MDNTVATFFIGTNTASSKNGKIWTGTYFIASEQTQRWQKHTRVQWEVQKERFLQAIKDLSKPLYIEFTFIRKSRHKFDYINACQTMQDEMKHKGWIPEDDTTEIKPYFGDAIYDKHHAGCLIRLLKTKPII